MRTSPLRALVLLGLLLPAPARAEETPPADLASAEAASKADSSKQAIQARLQNLKIDLDFTDSPLADVIDFIRDFAQINIVVDPRVYEAATDPDIKVSVKVHDLPLRLALKLLLESRRLAMTYRDGVLMILPPAEAAKEVVMKIYDVRDLLAKIENFEPPKLDLSPPGKPLNVIITIPEEPVRPIDEETLVNLIQTHTGKGDWDANPNASIKLANGLLVVTNTPEVHLEIERLIGGLRAFK